MSLEFTNPAGAQYVDFGTGLAGVIGLTAKSVAFWVKPDDFGAAYELIIISDGTGTDTDELFDIVTQITTGKIGLVAHFSTTNGVWLTTSATLTAGVWSHVVITYDGSAVGNNPVIYINGVSVAVTRSTAPVGTYRTGTGGNLYVGTPSAGAALDGKMEDPRIYNVVLTAAQVLALYNDGAHTPNFNQNLVWNPQLSNCIALSGAAYDGFVLTSSQKIYDRIGCLQGTPSGSPVGSSNTP